MFVPYVSFFNFPRCRESCMGFFSVGLEGSLGWEGRRGRAQWHKSYRGQEAVLGHILDCILRTDNIFLLGLLMGL